MQPDPTTHGPGNDPPGSFELRPTLKVLARLLGQAVAGTVIALAGTEVVLRLAGLPNGWTSSVRAAYDIEGKTMGPFIAGATVRLAWPPEVAHTVTCNSLGCRGAEPDESPDPPILCVGDSMTFGFGCEDDETWPAQLARLLRDAGTPRAVVNLSSGHLLIDDELHYLERALPVLKPAAVVLVVPDSGYLDPIDRMSRTPHQRSLHRESKRRRWPSSWIHGSAVYEARSVLAQWRQRLVLQAEGRFPPAFDEDLGTDGLRLRDRFREKLAEFRSQVLASGAKFVLAAYPAATMHDRVVRFEEPWSRELAQDGDTEYADVFAAFRAAGAGNDLLLLPWDMHTSPKGNSLVAGTVLESLRRIGLVPAPPGDGK